MDNKENDDDLPKEINCYKIGQLLYSYRNYKIYAGTNSLTKEEVTIKIINKKYINGNSKLLEFVNNEILYTKLFSHSNILKLLEQHENPLYVFMIMENFRGEFLSTYMARNKKLEETKAIKIFSKIISAMAYIHNLNVCHLNITLDSILINENDENLIKIFDFRFSQYYYAKFKTLNEHVGTSMFTCPEMLSIDNYIPELADVWSCGIMLCYLLNGEFPINPDTNLNIEERYVVPNNINEDLQDLLKNMLYIDIDKRYRFDDVVNCKYFTDRNIDSEILEEIDNNFSIDNENLKKIYERYLRIKFNLGKKDNKNALINFEIIIHRELLADNQRMSKLIEMFGKKESDTNPLPKRNYAKKKEKEKEKEKENIITNKIVTNDDNNFPIKKKGTFTDFKFNTNKIKTEVNPNNFKKRGVKGKRKSVFDLYNRFQQKSFLFEIPENLIGEKEEFQTQFQQKKENENNKDTFETRKNTKRNTNTETNSKIGKKIGASSVGHRRKTQFSVVGEKYADFLVFSQINKKKKSKIEEKKINNIDKNKGMNMLEKIEEENKNKPVFNMDELYEDVEESDKEEKSNKIIEEKENDKITENSEESKSNNNSSKRSSSSSSSNSSSKSISIKKDTQENKEKNNEFKLEINLKTSINNTNINNNIIKNNKEDISIKKINNKNDKIINNYKTKNIKMQKDNKNIKSIKNNNKILNKKNENLNKSNNALLKSKKNEKDNNIKNKNNKKIPDSFLTKQKTLLENISKKNALNKKMIPNKSTDNIIDKAKKKKNLNITTKINKNEENSNYESKTPIFKKKSILKNKNYFNTMTNSPTKKENENQASSPYFSKNKNNEDDNYYTSSYFNKINDNDFDEDEIERENRKLYLFFHNIPDSNRKPVKVEGEKVVIKKFVSKAKTPDKGIRKKSTLFYKSKVEKAEEKLLNNDKNFSDNKNFYPLNIKINNISKKNSVISESNSELENDKIINNRKNSNMYDAILENLTNLNNAFDKSGENNEYHKFMRRKITPDKYKKKNKTARKSSSSSNSESESNSDSNSSGDSNSSSNSNSNSNNKSKSENKSDINSESNTNTNNNNYNDNINRTNITNNNHESKNTDSNYDNNSINTNSYYNNNETNKKNISIANNNKKGNTKNRTLFIKNRIIQNHKNNLKKINTTSDNNSSFISNKNKKNDILNNVDNFNFVNNEYNSIKYQMNKNNKIVSKIFSPRNDAGKMNTTETELSSEEQTQYNFNNSKDHLVKAKKGLRDRLISVSSDLSEERVQSFNGNVIDLKYISLKNYEQTVKVLKNELKRRGVKFKRIDYNSYKCQKGIREFFVDIVKIPKNIFYYRFYNKRKQINNFH